MEVKYKIIRCDKDYIKSGVPLLKANENSLFIPHRSIFFPIPQLRILLLTHFFKKFINNVAFIFIMAFMNDECRE